MRSQDYKKGISKSIGIVAPSFFIENERNFAVAIEYMNRCGFKLVFGDTTYCKFFNTTGTAVQRAADINRMFENPNIELIITTDGGCRAMEILQHLDFDLIKNNPKPLCGFSDITHILLAVYSKVGNPAIHGMDLINGFGQHESIIKERNIGLFWSIVREESSQMSFEGVQILKRGIGVGVAIGGWLNAIHNLAGTEYFPRDEKIILFWEAIDEEPNRISMMLHSLRLSGLFERLEGMVIGRLSNCIEKEYFDCVPNIEDIILDSCVGYDFPIIMNAPFGHGDEKSTFKLGTKISINTEELK